MWKDLKYFIPPLVGLVAFILVLANPSDIQDPEVGRSVTTVRDRGTLDGRVRAVSKEERGSFKGREIAKRVKNITKQRDEYKIEILKTEPIDGGIVVFARAWDANGQIGFGEDGSVDIERFRIINPPVLVPDPTGDVIREVKEKVSVASSTLRMRSREIRTIQYRYREDPQEALLQSLEHTISVKKEKFGPANIVIGKIGNTTTTVYPDADPETTTVDGQLQENDGGTTWATIQAAAGDAAGDSFAAIAVVEFESSGSSSWTRLGRFGALFDTSAVGSDTVSSATVSVHGRSSKEDSFTGNSFAVNVYSFAPASNTSLVGGDYDSLGTTEYSTDVTYASWSDSAYNDFALNATGIAAIDGAGVSKFGFREATYDAPDTTPTDESGVMVIRGYSADQTGTSNDPKLVVEHTGAVAPTFHPHSLF